MKRDMDLIRAILAKAEASEPDESVASVDGWDQPDFAYNVWLMREAGLVVATVIAADNRVAYAAHVSSLTWDGHDFLDAVRSDSIWDKTKAAVLDVSGSAAFDVIKQLAGAIALKAALAHLGLPT